MKLTIACLISFFAILFSCKQPVENKQTANDSSQATTASITKQPESKPDSIVTKVKDESFHSDDIGWTIEIPSGWTITGKDVPKANKPKGNSKNKPLEINLATNTIGGEAQESKHLLAFQKDQFNSFNCGIVPMMAVTPNEYEQNVKASYQSVYNTFTSQGIRVDTVSGKEIIQGKEFYMFHITMYSPEGQPILWQIMYNRLVNGYDFGVIVNASNEADKETMMNTFKNSKFDKSRNP